MERFQLEEVMVMKPVRTGAMFSIGAVLGPAVALAALYYGFKAYKMLRERVREQFGAEERRQAVSNLVHNAGVVPVREQQSTLVGQAVGQTGNDYMRAFPVHSFGQNFGGRSF
jgi:NAD(P)-dependent dehydrogenase (short-subunit alcohol dehydrogenase family)